MIAQTTILPWRRGLIDRSWRALYRRAPDRYFRRVAALLVLFAVLVAIVASLFSAFYLRMTGAQLLIEHDLAHFNQLNKAPRYYE